MLGTFLQVSLLFINAIAILNEERFLARSMSRIHPSSLDDINTVPVGWVSTSRSQAQNANVGYNQGYDQTGYGNQDVSIKARLIDLISAVRTLMRSEWSSLVCLYLILTCLQYL